MGNTFYFQWEVRFMELLQSSLGAISATFAYLCSYFGEELIMVAIIAFLYWCYDKKWAKYLAINVLVGLSYSCILKNVVLRRRPYFDNPNIKCLKPLEKGADLYDITAQGYSFPSTHSVNSVTVYGSLSIYKNNGILRTLCGIIIFLVGISRIILGVHYPTDVFCGWLFGLYVLVVIPFLRKKINKDWLFYLIILAFAIPGFFFCNSNDFYSSLGLMIGVFIGFIFEEHYVNFEKAKGVLPNISRFVVGLAIFGILNVALKLPFSKEFLESGTMMSFMVRTIRYAFETFVVVGIYPMFFSRVSIFRDK